MDEKMREGKVRLNNYTHPAGPKRFYWTIRLMLKLECFFLVPFRNQGHSLVLKNKQKKKKRTEPYWKFGMKVETHYHWTEGYIVELSRVTLNKLLNDRQIQLIRLLL